MPLIGCEHSRSNPLFRAVSFLVERRQRAQALQDERVRLPAPLFPVLDRPPRPAPAGGKGHGIFLEGGAESPDFLSDRHWMGREAVPPVCAFISASTRG
jgi:hypothetical protein